MRLYDRLLNGWAKVAGRPRCRRINNFLINLGARGLGVGNFSGAFCEEEWFLREIVTPRFRSYDSPTVFDVGANEGDYSLLVKRILPGAAIHAFEPHPTTFSRLQNNVVGLGIHCHEYGLGAREEQAQLWDYAESARGSSHATIYPAAITEMTSAPISSLPIRVRTLDGVCAELGVKRIDFLKIDVEGHELACLQGAAGLISGRQIGMVQFEFNAMHMEAQVTMAGFYNVLKGFRLFRLIPSGMIELDRGNPLMSNLYGYQNIVALPFD